MILRLGNDDDDEEEKPVHDEEKERQELSSSVTREVDLEDVGTGYEIVENRGYGPRSL